jgi:aspartyl/asparaginyl-tRNA synthetase
MPIGNAEEIGKKFEFPVEWGLDLQTEHERWLTEEHVGRPVVVMNYPEQIKAFYMRLNDDGRTVAAMDVLAPGIGEIIGGSQREERLDMLDARMRKFGLDPAHYSGTATSAATARCRTPASASASSAWWSMSADWPTSAMRSPTRARRATAEF